MIIYSSDGSNSSPTGDGPAGSAFVINGKNPHYFPMETGTNNEAEMRGFKEAVTHASKNTTGQVLFCVDSQWVAYVVAGYLGLSYLPHYNLAVKNRHRFLPMLNDILERWDASRMTLKWVRRNENKEADTAANIARQRAIDLYKSERK